MDNAYLKTLIDQWGIDVAAVCPDTDINGSPERTILRMVVTTPEARSFVLEEIASQTAKRKGAIATLLAVLADKGMDQVHPYLADCNGHLINIFDGRCWQLRPYVPGIPLPRPEYLEDAWRGKVLADFLIALRRTSTKISDDFLGESFSINHFINVFEEKLAIFNPDVLETLKPVRDYLAREFFPLHDTFPTAFCHGDYHPLNVVWSEDAILSVIDWEFCGLKPEAYDLALLIGCIGVEHPRSLMGPLIQSLLSALRGSGIYSDLSLLKLPEMVIALRFAWLSEWLRKKDWDMVRLELDYIDLLFANRASLATAWYNFSFSCL
jgi:homoserine kinase type II